MLPVLGIKLGSETIDQSLLNRVCDLGKGLVIPFSAPSVNAKPGPYAQVQKRLRG
jgi:hypothetical protein